MPPPTTALAATTGCDGLQAALNDNANAVVTLNEGAVCHGHINLPQRVITLEGAGAGATFDGQGKNQILSGVNVGSTTIRNLSFVNGRAFEDDGGAIQISGNSAPTIEDNDFFSNQATDGGAGGAVAIEVDNLTVNKATRGGGGPVTLRGNTFGEPDHGNVSDGDGGAVFINAFLRSVTVEDNSFDDNESNDNRGGGLSIDASQRVTLDGNTFTGNQAADDGGGASVDTCLADVTSNVFASNHVAQDDASLDGGGLFLNGNVCRQAALTRGDAVATTQADNRFRLNTINGEFSNGRGGGEFIENLDVVSTGDRFVGNTIEGTNSAFGGGLGYSGFTGISLVARNLVAAGNEAAPAAQDVLQRGLLLGNSRGGGVFLSGDGRSTTFEIDDSTIEANSAGLGSGIGARRTATRA